MGKVMGTVRHVLKDGKQVQDVRGHVVRIEEAKAVYALLDSINDGKERRTNEHNGQTA